MILNQNFYNLPTIQVARELLGCYLIRKTSQGILIGKIIETEAYCGPKDKANHASKGLTPRTAPMFGKAGYSYIYLIYGMYNCLNIVTEKESYPAAVLVRSIEPIEGVELMIKNRNLNPPTIPPFRKGGGLGGISESSPLIRGVFALRGSLSAKDSRAGKVKNLTNGPGKLCQALSLNREQNNLDITTKKNNFWIENAQQKDKIKIKKGPRVGVDYAKEYKDKLWRFWI